MPLGNLITSLRWIEGLTACDDGGSDGCMGVEPKPLLAPGSTIGGYELLECLGTGGFGHVYRARHPVIAGDVAIKVLHAARCTDQKHTEAFIGEAKTAARIAHPGIVKIIDVGTHDGRPYIVMEYARGRPLSTVLEQARLPLDEALAVLGRIAAAVDAVHQGGVCHHDLKPGNVIVLDDGSIKLIDFGLATLAGNVDLTATAAAFGTPLYMSPEQCRGQRSDAASDLYSFGALAYHVLGGSPPFTGDALTVALHHVRERPRYVSTLRPEVGRTIDRDIGRLLAKHPEARPRPLAPLVAKWRERARPYLAVSGAAAVVVVATIVIATGGGAKPIDPTTVHVLPHLEIAELGEHVSIDPDGQTVRYFSDGAPIDRTWQGPPARRAATAPYRSAMPDGRVVETSPDGVTLGSRQLIGGAIWGEACSNGHVAMLVDTKLVDQDLASGTIRELASAPGAPAVRWSPNCEQLIWTDTRGAHVTDLGGSTRDLAVTLLGDAPRSAAAAFLANDAVAYCGRDDRGPALLVHYLDRRAPDATLVALEPHVHDCSVAAAAGHVVIVTSVRESQPLVFDRGVTPPASVKLPRAEDARLEIEAFDGEQHAIVARGSRRLEYVAIDDGASSSEPVCPGSIRMIDYLDRPVHVVRDGAAFVLQTRGTCAEVARLPLPQPGEWSLPACAKTKCVGAQLDGGAVAVYELMPSPHLIARVPLEGPARTATPGALVAITGDASHIMVARSNDEAVELMAADGSERRTYRDSPNRVISIIGGNDEFFAGYARAVLSSIDRIALDGKTTILMHGTTFVDALSPSGNRIAATRYIEHRALTEVELR